MIKFKFFKALLLSGAFFQLVTGLVQAQSSSLYFPPINSEDWEKMSISEAGFDQEKMGEFLNWLSETDTRAFLILKDGKIVIEEYWGNKLTGLGQMDANSYWYWASAGKTLTAALIGIAEEQKLLKLKDRSQKYLGTGWTSLSQKQEKKIRLIHHLTMTTGLNDQVSNLDDTTPSSFQYLADPGKRWTYHNATYTVLDKVIEASTGMDMQEYFRANIGDKIGMKGFWQKTGQNNVFFSTPRSMGRFGLLLLANGSWDGNKLWEGQFFKDMIQPSQQLNPSYGYLTWLNGESSYLLPGSQTRLPGSLIKSAPDDMYQAMGKNGQFLMVVPSQNLVIVRVGGAPGNLPVPFLLARQIWDRLGPIIK